MADRKQFLNYKKPNPKLLEVLETSKTKTITEEELDEQRISFAFGNAPANSTLITKDSVRHASKNLLLRS